MDIQSLNKTWKQPALAGLPYLLFLIWMHVNFQIIAWLKDIELFQQPPIPPLYLFIIPPAALIIIVLYYAWKQGWPLWSGSWAGIAIAFIFHAAISPSWLYVVIIGAVMLLIWISLRDSKTSVLAALSLTLIVAEFLYRDVWHDEFFYQVLLALLTLIAPLIVLTKKWVWPTLGALLLLSSVNTYALMTANSYEVQSPYLRWIPTNDDAAVNFFFLSLSWQLAIVFIPLIRVRIRINQPFPIHEDQN